IAGFSTEHPTAFTRYRTLSIARAPNCAMSSVSLSDTRTYRNDSCGARSQYTPFGIMASSSGSLPSLATSAASIALESDIADHYQPVPLEHGPEIVVGALAPANKCRHENMLGAHRAARPEPFRVPQCGAPFNPGRMRSVAPYLIRRRPSGVTLASHEMHATFQHARRKPFRRIAGARRILPDNLGNDRLRVALENSC